MVCGRKIAKPQNTSRPGSAPFTATSRTKDAKNPDKVYRDKL
jgi:hypothetical protein